MQLRTGIVEHQPEPMLSGEVECDEVYVIAGHKGHPGAVKKNDAGVGGGGSRGRVDVARSRRNGRLLVVAAFLAATASRDLAGEVTALLRLLQFVHNTRIRGKGLMTPLLALLNSSWTVRNLY